MHWLKVCHQKLRLMKLDWAWVDLDKIRNWEWNVREKQSDIWLYRYVRVTVTALGKHPQEYMTQDEKIAFVYTDVRCLCFPLLVIGK